MLAKISSGKSVFGVLNYNKIKVDKDEAAVLYAQKMFVSGDGTISLRDCMDSFYPYLAVNQRTENVVFHASINPDPKDKLSDEQIAEVARRYMEKLGYGNQPYLVVKHTDIDRVHAHIISLRIDETGKKINDSYEVARSMKICKQLEQEFGLIPLKKGHRENEAPTKKIDYRAGDIKHQVGNITKAVMSNYNFQSFGEYRTLLEIFHVTVEEVKGEYRGKPYQGLNYSATDENNEKVGVPIKASRLGKAVGYEALQKKFEQSKVTIEKSGVSEKLKPIIGKAMKRGVSTDDFKQSLLQSGIGCVFRRNSEGRIYGVSFIDYQNQIVLNGSRLGKEFSANVFNDLFKDSPERNIERTADTKLSMEMNRSGQSAESYGVQRTAADDSLSIGPGMFEQHGEDWEEERFTSEKKNEEKIRQKKKKRRGLGM